MRQPRQSPPSTPTAPPIPTAPPGSAVARGSVALRGFRAPRSGASRGVITSRGVVAPPGSAVARGSVASPGRAARPNVAASPSPGRRRGRALAVLSGIGLVAAGLAVPTASAAAPAVRSVSVSAARQRAALAYWTPERLASAVDLDAAPVTAPGRTVARGPARHREPYTVPGALPATGTPTGGTVMRPAASSPQRWTSGGLISSTAGKVFFANSSGTYACSGDAVNSGNKSIVATAGHCVVDANTGEVYQNWVFIPSYDHGNRPYGTFTASSLHWMSQRIGDPDPTWDAAFATMSPLGGTRLVDAVGGEGIGFDQSPGQYVYSFGYGGSDAEGNGEQLNWCAGTEVFETGHPGGGIWGIDCVQTGGSSGGPFLQGFDPSTGIGTQIGNISVSGSGREWHPYYGWEAHDAYNAADAA